MKVILLLFCVTALIGCSESMFGGASYGRKYNETTVEEQARLFFEQNPEYLYSQNKESQLYAAFQRILDEPNAKDLGIYQILLRAHSQLSN